MNQTVKQLNGLKYLYLTNISEPEDNVLRLIVEEGIISPEEEFTTINKVTIGGKPIRATTESKKFELTFMRYVAYSVRNESFTVDDTHEKFEGENFRIYTQSHFLDYITKSTTPLYEGDHKHYGIICLNHIIDVASFNEPEVLEIKSSV